VVNNGESQNGNSKVVTFSALKPQLFVEAPKASDAVLFYKEAFGAEEVNRVSLKTLVNVLCNRSFFNGE
ncbi:hypothetical protein, partial [Klebsiella pneumoniae]|uniref:hypothetical protein n=1 Tax=Klebsiella pneumoniae TaxID=573 RepID=UPI003013EE76